MPLSPDTYARKTQGRGAYWKERTMEQSGNYCEGIADALGISVAQCQASRAGRNYQAGIQAATPGNYDQGVAGKAQKWFNRYRAAFTQ